VLPISRLRIYDSGSQAQNDIANDTMDETPLTVSSQVDTDVRPERAVSSSTVTVPLDTNEMQRQQDFDLSNFERSHDQTTMTDELRTERGGRPGRLPLVPLGEILRLRQQANAAIGTNRATRPASIAAAKQPSPRHPGRPPGTPDEREQLAAYLGDFARELGDEAPLSSTITRVLTLFQMAGTPRERWADTLYQSRAITQERTAQIRTLATEDGHNIRRKNKMPYFLAVLEDLLGLGEERPAAPDAERR
jgi:hypothetical protein